MSGSSWGSGWQLAEGRLEQVSTCPQPSLTLNPWNWRLTWLSVVYSTAVNHNLPPLKMGQAWECSFLTIQGKYWHFKLIFISFLVNISPFFTIPFVCACKSSFQENHCRHSYFSPNIYLIRFSLLPLNTNISLVLKQTILIITVESNQSVKASPCSDGKLKFGDEIKIFLWSYPSLQSYLANWEKKY